MFGGTDVLGGHLSRGTNVGGTVVGGTNVTPPLLIHELPSNINSTIEQLNIGISNCADD